jgi:hypothetical protein
MLARFEAELGDLLLGGVRLEQGVIDHLRQVCILGNDAQCGREAFGTGIDDIAGPVETGADAKLVRAVKLALVSIGVRGALLFLCHCDEDFAGDDLDELFY